MNWRKWNFVLHRDIGYLCIGLTLLYAISGVAVNHITHSFNPSYKIVHISATITPVADEIPVNMDLVDDILKQLGETGKFKNVFRPSPDSLQIFVEGNTITADLRTGKVEQEKVKERPFLFEVNYLHLNKPKKSWTWIADIYAIALGYLAISGMLMMFKKKGVQKRGLWLTIAGFVIPIVALMIYL